MRYPPEHKKRTRQAILEAAGRVFRRQGYQGGGVDAVMKEAGLTHGGFYSHFANKEHLLAEAILTALSGSQEKYEQWTAGRDGAGWIRAFLDGYLSSEHRSAAEQGCVAPALISELARSGEAARRSFEQGLRAWADKLAGQMHHLPEAERHDAALGAIATSVGGLALARAVADPELADRFLRAAREMVERAYLHETSSEGDPGGDPGGPGDPGRPERTPIPEDQHDE